MIDPISLSGMLPLDVPGKADEAPKVEEMFARMLLKEIRRTMPESLGGKAMEAFGDIFDAEIAKEIAASGQFSEGKPSSAPTPHRRAISARVSSAYGMRTDPFTGARRRHQGVDLAAPRGTSIHPVREGEVVFAGERGGYGNLVIVDHGDGLQSRYAHCNQLLVSEGDRVGPDASIATVGATGRATGPHLHLEIRRHGRSLDPAAEFDLHKSLKPPAHGSD